MTTAKDRESLRRRNEMQRYAVIAGDTSPLDVVGATSSSEGNPGRKEKRPLESTSRSNEGKRTRTAEIESTLTSTSSSSAAELELSGAIPSTSGQNPVEDVVPIFGSISVSGRSREMEDAVALRSELCRPEITCRRPVHFFAVYDGHGGSHVSRLCKNKMHIFMEEELMRGTNAGEGRSSEELCEESWRTAIRRCFERMDEATLSACACDCGSGTICECEKAGVTSEIVGSTAVVALLTPDLIIVANCGDSRAVLSRGGQAVPLSTDQKPDRPDELARIEAAGGRVIYLDGARVLGILAMSRALGDKYLKPIVISEPEITIIKRSSEDECLILASDGLWDVLSNNMACEVVCKCLFEGTQSTSTQMPNTEHSSREQMYQSRCSLAAALLTRLALGRKSEDNISVIVIDLKRS